MAHVKPPLLPLDGVAIECETRPAGLIDSHRSRHLARLPDRRRIIISIRIRDRHRTFIHDPEDLLLVHIDDYGESCDSARPAVAPAPRIMASCVSDAPAFLFLRPVVTRRKDPALDEGKVGDAALLHRFDEIGVRLDFLLESLVFFV